MPLISEKPIRRKTSEMEYDSKKMQQRETYIPTLDVIC